MKVEFPEKFKTAVIGLGYVGIPLALRFAAATQNVIGIDVKPAIVNGLNSGKSPSKHIADRDIASMLANGFRATNDHTEVREADAIIICVPTPLNVQREPDLTFVEMALEQIGPYLKPGQAISLESTTWPGTTEEIVRPFVERLGFTIGEDFYLLYSPEREDPGNATYSVKTIPKVVSGSTPACLEVADRIYSTIVDRVVPVSSTRCAEMVKLLENIHRSVNIGLVNEMKIVAERMGLDIFEVIDAAATKPFGFTPYYPGPGIGGHCIPVDPFYLTWKAHEYGLHTRFIELAGEINAGMPDYVVTRLIKILNEHGKPLHGSKILALGLAYKRDIDDLRESPAIDVMELVRQWGGLIDYADPHIPRFPEMRNHVFDLESQNLSPKTLASYDAVIYLTDHSAFDRDMILQHAQLIVDTHGKFDPKNPKVIRA